VEKIPEKKLMKLKEYHNKLSQVYGFNVGLSKEDAAKEPVI
jgi:hypothetical protein